MKPIVLGLTILCGFLGGPARADHERGRGRERVRRGPIHSGPAIPGGAHWTAQREAIDLPRASGRFGRGRRVETLPPAGPATGWGGPNPMIVPPAPEPQWPIPGVGLPYEGRGAFGHYGPGDFVRGPVPLYPRVRYKDRDEEARNAVTVVVAVADPNGCDEACAPPRCVFVPVCVPPCPLRDVKVRNGGSKIKFDYGEYTVELESKNGVVTVDYDD